jgi:hypothetical protein
MRKVIAPLLLAFAVYADHVAVLPRLIELPLADHLIVRGSEGTAEFANVSEGAPIGRALVSFNGTAQNLVQLEFRAGSLRSVGPWKALLQGPAASRSVQDLTFASPITRLDVRVTLKGTEKFPLDHPRFFTVAIAGPSPMPSASKNAHEAWGHTIDPGQWGVNPGYPETHLGKVGATVAFWGKAMGRSDLPTTYDAFTNDLCISASASTIGSVAASAGRFMGLLAYGTYFLDLSDLEAWIEGSVPVLCQVGTKLVLVVGFDAKGNPQIAQAEKLKVVPRANFEAEWKLSGNAVLLIHPNPLGTPDQTGPTRWVNKEHDG